MKRPLFLSLLIIACAMTATSQSGRKVRNVSPSTPAVPVQPPTNPATEPAARVDPIGLFLIPERIREREIQGLPDGTFRLADFQGKVIVINVWASWCGPCRREVPEYDKVRKAYEGKDVEFIALTAEDRSAFSKVNKFVRDVKFGFRVGWADPELAATLMNGKTAIPQTLVLDGGGQIVKHWTGYSPGRSADRLKDTIDQALLRLPRL
jgi:thiol-disulfide isomerase/thioredoxin